MASAIDTTTLDFMIPHQQDTNSYIFYSEVHNTILFENNLPFVNLTFTELMTQIEIINAFAITKLKKEERSIHCMITSYRGLKNTFSHFIHSYQSQKTQKKISTSFSSRRLYKSYRKQLKVLKRELQEQIISEYHAAHQAAPFLPQLKLLSNALSLDLETAKSIYLFERCSELSPLFYSLSMQDHEDLFKTLLLFISKYPALVEDFNAKFDGETKYLLHLIARSKPNLLTFLVTTPELEPLRKIIDPNPLDMDKRTPLDYAEVGSAQAKFLIQLGAKRTPSPSNSENSPHVVIKKSLSLENRLSLFRYWSCNLNDILQMQNNSGHSLLHLLVMKRNDSLLPFILHNMNCSGLLKRDKRGKLPIDYADKDSEIYSLLQEKTSQQKGKEKTTPQNSEKEKISDGLIQSLDQFISELSDMLNQKPETISSLDDKGNTIIHLLAARNTAIPLAMLLQKSPQLINIEDSDGHTPMYFAAEPPSSTILSKMGGKIK